MRADSAPGPEAAGARLTRISRIDAAGPGGAGLVWTGRSGGLAPAGSVGRSRRGGGFCGGTVLSGAGRALPGCGLSPAGPFAAATG